LFFSCDLLGESVVYGSYVGGGGFDPRTAQPFVLFFVWCAEYCREFGFIVVQCAEFVYIVVCCFGYIVASAIAVGEYRLVPSTQFG